MITYSPEDVRGHSVGDVVTLNGKSYRLLKKTSTAIAIIPYRWYHKLSDRLDDFFYNGGSLSK